MIPDPESLQAAIAARIQQEGPLTVAAFMDLALYDPELGYYARVGQRSGRAGDFFTSVDVGPLFGELLAGQFAEMLRIVETGIPNPESRAGLDVVEAGAGNGRLSADILRAIRAHHPDLYPQLGLHLVEASAAARAEQAATLGDVAGRLTSSSSELPDAFAGVLFANELLDAMPVHQVVMREEGLREVFVACGAGSSGPRSGGPERPALQVVEREPSTPALQAYLDAAGVSLEPGARAEIGLAAVAWMRRAARRLARGFIVLIDYGHEARELYSTAHAGGTLTSFTRHTMAGSETARPGWLVEPGGRDLTAHVDFTSIRAAAEAEGCVTLGLLDQTYFLLGILAPGGADLEVRLRDDPKTARALKTLIMPGGLGSTMKVLVLGKNVGTPRLAGCSYRVRVT